MRRRLRTKNQPTLRPVPPIIVKVQRALHGGTDREVLIYNEARTILLTGVESDLPIDVRVDIVKTYGHDWLKFYTYAIVDAERNVHIQYGEFAPEQPW
jgi:hypothetical protein